MRNVNIDYESPASEVVEIEGEQVFAGSGGDGTGSGSDWPEFVGDGDGTGSGSDWPDFS